MSVQIIAEIGVNHNGDLELAFESILAAKRSGADVVKFQTFVTEQLVTFSAEKATYQKTLTGSRESQFSMLKRLELSREQHFQLIEFCYKHEIDFLSTPFDLVSLEFLVQDLGLSTIKLSSGDLTNGPMLLAAARSGCDLIVSTGMSSLAEVESALKTVAFGYLNPTLDPKECLLHEAYSSVEGQKKLHKHVSLLHCTSEYPAAISSVNLNVLDTFKQSFGLRIGYSDHTLGVDIAAAAVVKGACVIEKHFTLDNDLPGPDHQASLEPLEFKAMVDSIRRIELALGDGIKKASNEEYQNRIPSRKSIVCEYPIAEGELLTKKNITIKRPGNGVSPMMFWSVLNKPASKPYSPGDLIEE